MSSTTEAPKRGRKPEPAEAVNARGAALKERRRAQGLIRVEIWIKPEHKEQAKAFEAEHQ